VNNKRARLKQKRHRNKNEEKKVRMVEKREKER